MNILLQKLNENSSFSSVSHMAELGFLFHFCMILFQCNSRKKQIISKFLFHKNVLHSSVGK